MCIRDSLIEMSIYRRGGYDPDNAAKRHFLFYTSLPTHKDDDKALLRKWICNSMGLYPLNDDLCLEDIHHALFMSDNKRAF